MARKTNIDPALIGIAEDARGVLDDLARGEADNLNDWRRFGELLLAGRDLFPSDDKGFGKWKKGNIYDHPTVTVRVDRNTESAVMWMAGHPDQLEYVRGLNPTVRSPRQLHAKWKAALVEVIEEGLQEGDFDDPEFDAAEAFSLPTDAVELQAAVAAHAARRAAKAEKEEAADRAEQDRIAGLVEQRVAVELDRIFKRLPKELREQVKAALGEQGQIEAPAKPKRARKPKAAPVEDAEIVQPAA